MSIETRSDLYVQPIAPQTSDRAIIIHDDRASIANLYPSLNPEQQSCTFTQEQVDVAAARALTSGKGNFRNHLPCPYNGTLTPNPDVVGPLVLEAMTQLRGQSIKAVDNATTVNTNKNHRVDCTNNPHTVKNGDTLYQISRVYDVTYEALIAINTHITNPNLIYPGMQINVPGNCNIALFSNATNPPSYNNEADPNPVDFSPFQTEIETTQEDQTSGEFPTNDNNTLVEFAKENGTIVAGTTAAIIALYVIAKKGPGRVSRTLTNRLSSSRGKQYY